MNKIIRYPKKSLANQCEKNPNWMGDKVSYNALHTWIHSRKPKSMFCEKCGKITDKLDCANISGEYKRDISDFKWLCRKCHMQEDGRLKRLIQMRIIKWNEHKQKKVTIPPETPIKAIQEVKW